MVRIHNDGIKMSAAWRLHARLLGLELSRVALIGGAWPKQQPTLNFIQSL